MSPYLFQIGKDMSVAMTLDTSSRRGELKIATALPSLSYVNSLW